VTTLFDSRNLNTLWASIIAETLVRCGLKTAIICPGSRSAPLTIAFVQHPQIETIPVLDERSASFFALGIAKQTHRPVVLICSSGTAGANFYPAVIEAKESRVPLLVLTADRPPELRDCNAGQAIEQQRLFGNYTNYYTELAMPELNISRLQYLRQRSAQCYQQCLYPISGVVHINIPFRDPLAPIVDPEVSAWCDRLPDDFFDHLQPFTKPQLQQSIKLPNSKQGIIIAGVAQPEDPEIYVTAIARIANLTGFTVLAEALSPVRNYSHLFDRNLISTYDTILRNQQLAQSLKPDLVLRIGEMPTSKVLRQWLDTNLIETWIIDESDRSLDSVHGKTHNCLTSVTPFANSLENSSQTQDSTYSNAWEMAENQTRDTIDRLLQSESNLFEGKAAWLLSQVLPVNTPLFISNSMPVRDMEYFWKPNDRTYQIYVNRGANGIDGCLSTTIGIAHNNQPTVMLTGDLALLYDTNGFLIKPYLQGHLTIVLLNNNGGGIFGMLPIAQFNPPFEEFFSTPQNIEFRNLCKTYQVEYEQIQDWEHLSDRLKTLPKQGIRILEIKCDRGFDAKWRKENFSAIATGLI
jgi:2-succinyl-5-enolpyruvyl-6-hydroxy-3-cyclohexene-1-carboxylate synthase